MSILLQSLVGLLAFQASSALDMSAIFARISKASFAAGTIDKFRSHVEQTSAFELLDEVEKLVATKNADPEKIKIIKDLVNEQLIPALEATHKTGQSSVDARLHALDQCAAETKKRIDEIENTTAKTVDKAREEHRTCRGVSLFQTQSQGTKCQFLDFMRSPVARPMDPKNRAAMLKYSKAMRGYWCSMGEQIQACKDSLEKNVSCSIKQRKFEIGICTMAVQLKEACEDMSQECYVAAKKAYDDTVADTKELVKKWKTEYSAMKKIACFVDVWLNDNNPETVDATKFEKCKATSIDASSMDINYGTPTAQYQCKHLEIKDFPGTQGFIDNEYGDFKDAIDEVVPCLAAGAKE